MKLSEKMASEVKPSDLTPPEGIPQHGEDGDDKYANLTRSVRVLSVLNTYVDADGNELQTTLADLLTDLAHLCDHTGLDFAAALETAKGHYEAETQDKGLQFSEVAL